jgi:putative ABC transport system permease protein
MSRDTSRPAKRPQGGEPPRAAEWVLTHLHSDSGDFTHIGDFREAFGGVLAEKGRGAALRWYWTQVFRSLPRLALNKLYWSLSLFRNYVVISFRNFRKNAGFSLITLIGLAAGLACFILILGYARFEKSYDRFHEKTGRIYRLTSAEAPPGEKPAEFEANHPSLLAPLLKQEFPEVRHAARVFVRTGIQAVLQAGEKTFTQSGMIVDQDFLEVFTFPLLRGDRNSALSAPGSIVLTASAARKLFGGENPLLRTVRFREERGAADVTVTGVVRDVPRNSSFRFDYLVSVASLEADKKNAYMFNNWDVGNFFIYVELAGPGRRRALEEKFSAWLARERPERHANGLGFYLQPVEDIHLRSNIRGELATNNEIRTLRLFLAIALITLLIASVNYMNIVTARSAARAREIGIRKVTGAGRGRLFEQFLSESIVFSLLSLAAALTIVRLALPRFRAAVGIDLTFGDVTSGSFLLLVLGVALLTGLLSGAYPALALSAFQPVRVLRELSASGRRGARLRNLLVVGQFTASIVLIVCALVVSGQLRFISNQRLGFDREHVVVIPVRESDTRATAGAIRTSMLRRPEVEAVSVTSGLPTRIENTIVSADFTTDRGEKTEFSYHFDYTDENFLDVFKVELAAGRNLSSGTSADKDAVLVNETLVKTAGWAEGVGKKIPFIRGSRRIVGVVKDFRFLSFHEPTGPMALMAGGDANLAVRIRPGDVPKTMAVLKKVFEENTKTQPFDFFFLDDAFDAIYRKERRAAGIFGAFAILAVVIASLGLLGLAAFAVERRTKEIGIRKVVGAKSLQLAARLSREFVLLVLLANVIAWPVAYYAMSRWLEGFADRIGLGVSTFLLAGAGALVIALLTVGTQTLRAAAANPVDALRYE